MAFKRKPPYLFRHTVNTVPSPTVLEQEMLPISAAIRNRLTLVRMLRVLDFGE